MKLIPEENFEPKARVKSSKKSSHPQLKQSGGQKLTKEQQKAIDSAKRLTKYAIDAKPYSPREITNLIDEVRGNVLSLNFKRSQINGGKTKNPKKRHGGGGKKHPRFN